MSELLTIRKSVFVLKKPVSYGKLFLSTFYLSAFTFGGGYVIVPLMRNKFVNELGWLSEQDMLDITAIAQSCPGAMAVNASILVGYRVAGVTGAATTILGTVLPPLLIISVVSMFYAAFQSSVVISTIMRGMRAGVAAVIVSVVADMGSGVLKQRSILTVVMMAGAFAATYFFKVNVMLIVLVCAGIGLVQTLYVVKTAGREM